MLLAHGRDEKVDGGCDHREACCHAEVAHTAFDQVEVMDTDSETYTYDRPHKRRYEHGADDHRR